MVCKPVSSVLFQSTPPHGRRRGHGDRSWPCRPGFNPRLRTGGDGGRGFRSRLFLAGFNPRLRTGGDPIRSPLGLSSSSFQSTPPHGRRPANLQPGGGHHHVSIHASAREATTGPASSRTPYTSFNPRLRTGGDGGEPTCILGLSKFQSTPPHGRRPATSPMEVAASNVSIHASAREATCSQFRSGQHHCGFNPRLRTGGDCDRRWPARLKVLRA